MALKSGGKDVLQVVGTQHVVDEGGPDEAFWVEDTYPQLDENRAHWDLLDRVYNGGRDFITKANLAPLYWEVERLQKDPATGEHTKVQVDPEYDMRLEFTGRVAMSRYMLDKLVGFISQHPADRGDFERRGPWAKEYVANADRDRTESLQHQGVESFRRLLLHGMVYTVTDLAMTPESIAERLVVAGIEPRVLQRGPRRNLFDLKAGDAQALELVPFTYQVHPAAVTMPRFNRAGQLIECLLVDMVDNGKDLKSGSWGMDKVFRHYARDEWGAYRIEEKKGKSGKVTKRFLVRIAGGTNPIAPRIPVRVRRFRNRYIGGQFDPSRGISWLVDTATMDRAQLQLMSSLFWGLKDAASSQTVIGVENMPGIEQLDEREATRVDYMRAFRNRYVLASKEDTTEQLTHEFPAASTVLDALRETTNATMMTSGMRENVDLSVLALSGVAFQRAFQELNAILADGAARCEALELEQMTTAAAYMGDEPAQDGDSQWPRDYDLVDADAAVAMIVQLSGKVAPELINEFTKILARQVLGSMGQQDLAKLEAAIDKFEGGGAAGLSALLGVGQGGLAGQIAGQQQNQEQADAAAAQAAESEGGGVE